MTSIGETLRRERLRQGLELQKVSETTKIGTRMLQAMEAGDFSKLPGGVFTRSFIKQYAAALGMDPATLEPELKALHVEGDDVRRAEVRPDRPSHSFPSFADRGPEPNSLMASAVWVVLALLVCGGVYYIMNRNTGAAEPVERNVEGTPSPKVAAEPGNPAQTNAEKPAPAPAQIAASTPPPVEEPAHTPAATSNPVQVTLSASEPAWVSVTADGKTAFVGVLQPNEKREINASERVKVVAGNAGGIEISLNGKAIDSIGPKGQVRVVELTPAGAHVIPRTPPNPAPLL